MCGRIHTCGSYGEALNILGEYVNITSTDEMEESGKEMGIIPDGDRDYGMQL